MGDTSTADVILNAKSMGVYTIVSGIHPEAKTRQLADEAVLIPSDDHEALARFIRENKIDGVMTGASEFQICQMIQLCHKVGLPVYANEIQWHLCQDKACFKKLCREFNVPVVPEFEIDSEMKQADLTRIEYPVVVKPTDSCSSQGLSICFNENELRIAIPIAVSVSKSGRFLVEKCIISDNGFGCRYIVNNGEIYLSAVNDRYTVDKLDGCAHFGAVSRFPSKRIDSFINEMKAEKEGKLYVQYAVVLVDLPACRCDPRHRELRHLCKQR